jgi:hypothetical protein
MRMKRAIALASVLLLGTLCRVRAADDNSPEPPPDVTCRLDSGSGTFKATGGPKGVLVQITNPGSDGNATITFKAAPPSRVKFRFANARYLQTFRLNDGKHTWQHASGWSGARTVLYWDKTGRSVTSPPSAAVTMVLEPTKAGGIEVTVSTTRDAELGKELKVYWLQYHLKRLGPALNDGVGIPLMHGD